MLQTKYSLTICIAFFQLLLGCSGVSQTKFPKINGANLVSPPTIVSQNTVATVKQISANWVSVIPYAFIKKGESKMYFNTDRQWWGEKFEGTKMLIQYAQAENLMVMLKPHVWVQGDGWAGDFKLNSDSDQKNFETEYTKYILAYAEIAQEYKVPLFCVGTEFREIIKQHPEFWKKLILKVKKIYSGKLTYAANWDNYENVTFWNELDYVGIDAYFPLSKSNTPLTKELINSWRPIKNKLEAFSKNQNKPILFTEYGYKSCSQNASGHWETDGKEVFNAQAQINAYEALYKSYWKEDWFAGGFLWKWFLNSDRIQKNNTQFTPQKKPAIKIIKKYYK